MGRNGKRDRHVYKAAGNKKRNGFNETSAPSFK
jgi:hypothetical protein